MFNAAIKWIGLTAALLLVSSTAEANLLGMPLGLRSALGHLSFDEPALPPMAFTQFCMNYPNQCSTRRMRFRRGPVQLSEQRWQDLADVNGEVNARIAPERNPDGLAGEKWLINPSAGDCNDYAVTKRSALIERGWPARSLLLGEVITRWGEHHLILVVRTSGGDFVLDNMVDEVRPWFRVPYRWVRVQTPSNPNIWASIAARRV